MSTNIFNFIKNYSKVKAADASTGLVNLAASLDADGVAEAAISQKMDEHTEIVKLLVEAQADWKREQQEFENEEKLYNRRMAAAEKAQADLESNPDNKEAEQALAELLDAIEKAVPTLEKERKEAEQAKSYLDQLESAAKEVAEELKSLRSLVTEQQQAIKEAEVASERNRKMAEKAEVLAGLRTSGNKFDVAMNALKSQVEEKQKEAETHKIKAEHLAVSITQSSATDKYMSDAPDTSSETLQERLARLKKS
jgi:hypothetical protein